MQLEQQHAAFPFRSVREQIDQIRAWNMELRWGFSESELLDAERFAPRRPASGLCAPILVPYLPPHYRISGCTRTFHALWRLAAKSHRHSWMDEPLTFAGTSDVLKPYDADDIGPGLRWEVIDFGAGRGERAKDMLDYGPRPWPHLGILAAAALTPEWVRAMNGTDVPYVYLPGFLVRIRSSSFHSYQARGRAGMLLLSYADHVRIDMCPLHFKRNERCAIPSFVEIYCSVT